MPDVLIRNVSDADLRRIDEKARRHGLSRDDYLRRRIAQDAALEVADETASLEI